MEFLDNKISKQSQLRIIVGLLCISILYAILIKVDTVSIDSWSRHEIFVTLSNVLIFLYLYKFIRYDLKLELFFVFISIEVLMNLYYAVLALYRYIHGIGPDDIVFGYYEQTYSFLIGMSVVRFVSMVGIAVQLLMSNFFEKKIKIAVKLLGLSFLLQFICPLALYPLIGMLDGTPVEVSIIRNMYVFTNLFFSIIVYIAMVCLYVLAMNQDSTNISTEEEL